MKLAMVYECSMLDRSMFSYHIMIHVVGPACAYRDVFWFFFLIAQARSLLPLAFVIRISHLMSTYENGC